MRHVPPVPRAARGVIALLLLAALAACTPAVAGPAVAPTRTAADPAVRTAAAGPVIAYPATGGGRFATAPAARGTAGRGGTLLRYRVVVERDITGVPLAGFAQFVTATLGDPRGWTAGGRWRLRRVGPGD